MNTFEGLYIDNTGVVRYNLFPEEPKYEHYGLTQDDTEDFWDDVEEHKKALASAKESAVEVHDGDNVIDRFPFDHYDRLKGGEIVELPDGWKVEVREVPEDDSGTDELGRKVDFKKVAILKAL